jgi:hypothetical protein
MKEIIMMDSYPQSRYRYLMLVCLLLSIMALPLLVRAQGTTTEGTPIEIAGVVNTLGGGTMTVDGLTVDVSGIALDAGVTVGTTVKVTGILLPSDVIVAQVVIIIAVTPSPEATSEATPEVTPAVTPSPTTTPNPDVIIVIEGPVVNIVTNIITIYNFNVEVDPQHPVLGLIEVGDIVRVQGAFGSSGVVVATVVSNVSSTALVSGASVGLEGPVEAINGNTIVVNGIPVQLASNDPRLQTLQVGNFVSVQGNFQGSGANIVLVVVNITIVNNVIIDGNPFCWYHEKGMGMGHWHCDGMGMGGMGMGMGMGMGG